jgi:hypothetical protein
MEIKNFPGIGLWKLVSFEHQYEDGAVNYPFGLGASGEIMYDASGNMAAQIGDMRRANFKSLDRLQGKPEELKTAFEGYVAYFGTYTVDEEKKTVAHHVKSSFFPNWVGGDQVRFYKFEGNHLILRTPSIPFGGKNVVAVLVWERIH